MKNKPINKYPLSGIKVIDFSRLLPGPFCTMLMADLGADIVKVELPRMTDTMRVWPEGFSFINKNKKSLVINFQRPEGRKIIHKMLPKFDVLVESFRPGSMEKAGLGYKQVKKLAPKLIYCSITGYGQTGPWSRRASHDINYLASAGALNLNMASDGKPVLPPVPFGDLSGSLYGAIGILAALNQRVKTKKGQMVDVAMTESLFSLLCLPLAKILDGGKDNLVAGIVEGKDPLYGIYETSDNRFLALGCVEKFLRDQLLKHVGITDNNSSDHEPLRAKLKTIFKSKDFKYWKDLLDDKDAGMSPVLTIDEVINSEQFKARNIVRNGKSGSLVANPLRFSNRTYGLKSAKTPKLGSDTAATLRSFGYSMTKLKALKRSRIIL
ncbi:CaiB/BaiF CoA transferase family protein [Elusimicrobiota bacterium]